MENSIESSKNILNSLKMSVLLNLKTGDPIYDMAISFILTTFIAFLLTTVMISTLTVFTDLAI